MRFSASPLLGIRLSGYFLVRTDKFFLSLQKVCSYWLSVVFRWHAVGTYCTQREKYCRRSGLFITEISKETLPEAKIFPFFKLTNFLWKRGKFLRVFSKNFLRFPSTPHLAKPMLSAVFLFILDFNSFFFIFFC